MGIVFSNITQVYFKEAIPCWTNCAINVPVSVRISEILVYMVLEQPKCYKKASKYSASHKTLGGKLILPLKILQVWLLKYLPEEISSSSHWYDYYSFSSTMNCACCKTVAVIPLLFYMKNFRKCTYFYYAWFIICSLNLIIWNIDLVGVYWSF